jgi:hypothetical protein
MPRHLHEIAAAMNAYEWTTDGPVQGPAHAPSYCAIGALLRHAGVPHECIVQAASASLAGECDPLLKAKYGISDPDTVFRIILTNGQARSRADATWRVLGLVSGTRESDEPMPRPGPTRGGPGLLPAA